MKRLAAICLLLFAPLAQGRSVAVAVIEAQGLTEAQARRAHQAAEAALGELSGLELKPGPAPKRQGLRRGCGEELPARSASVPGCLSTPAAGLGADHALLISLKASGGRIAVEGFFIGDEMVRHQRREGLGEQLEAPLRGTVEALLPPWTRKGWGGLVVEAPPGAQLKLDGRRAAAPAGEPLAVTSQVHSVDVLFLGQGAVLHRLHVPEGERLVLSVAPAAAVDLALPGSGAASDERLRAVSFGLWGAGAAAIAGSLLAGALSRGVASELGSCQGTSRACLSYDAARQRQDQAEAYARTGNILLGTGAILAAAGVGVFTFDELRSREVR